MQTVQLVGITPDALADLIDNKLNQRFKEITSHLEPKSPTKYMTRSEVAKMLSVDVSTVHNMTVKSVLQKYQISGRVLYKREEVEASIIKLKN